MTQCDNATLYFYDELDPAKRQAFKAHLDDCPGCRAELAFLNGARESLQAPAAPKAVVDKLFAKTTRKTPFFSWLKPALVSAAVMGVGVFIFIAGTEVRSPAYDRQEVLAYLNTHLEDEYQFFDEVLTEFEEDF